MVTLQFFFGGSASGGHRLLAAFSLAALLLALGHTAPPAWGQVDRESAASAEALRSIRGESQSGKDGPLAKLGYELALLSERLGRVRPEADVQEVRPRQEGGSIVQRVPAPTSRGHVAVDFLARRGRGSELFRRLRALGLEGGRRSGRLVSGRLPAEALPEAASLEALRSAEPSRATVGAGAVTTEGDSAMASQAVRRKTGADGDGTVVGVLSNAYNQSGFGSAGDDIDSGDLPPRDRIQVLKDFSGAQTDEGRAMMQLIHDVAPGADLAFHTAFGGRAVFAEGIRALREEAGAEIIVDDVRYFASPFYQDGPVAQAVEDVVDSGAAYFSSAGNSARQSWGGRFQAADSTGPGGGTLHDFGGGDVGQEVEVPAGETIVLSFQWADPYASAGSTGADTDLDLYLANDQDSIVVRSVSDNVGGDPVEVVSFENTGSSSAQADLLIEKAEGPSPGRMRYVWFGGSLAIREHPNPGPTTFGQANSASGMAVAAAFYQSTPAFGTDPPKVEPFSSRGGIPILFADDGSRLESGQVRDVPGITGPDGTATTVAGFATFFGTSAAAPHLAAVAALLREKNPSLSPARTYRALEQTAIDMDAPSTSGFDIGFDRRTGFGFVQADRAFERVEGNVPPDRPAGLVARAEGGTVRLSWRQGTETDLAGYDLYRARGPLGDTSAAERVGGRRLPASTTTLRDSGLTDGQTYSYRLVAVDRAGARSEPSEQAEATPNARPPVVSGLSASAEGERVRLEWSPVGVPDLRAYRIYRDEAPIDSSAGPAGLAPLDSTAASTRSYLDTTVAGSSTYYYRVTAVDSSGKEGGFSGEVLVRSGDSTPPGPPAGLSARGDTTGRGVVTLQWSPPRAPDLSGHRVYRATGPFADTTEAELLSVLPATDSSYADTTASVGQRYHYRVAAIDTAANQSELSPEVTATPTDRLPPPAPSSLSATGGAESAQLDWSRAAAADVATYRIYRDEAPIGSSAGPEGRSALDSVKAGTTQYTDTTGMAGTEYHYRVTAVDSAGNESGFSAEAVARPRDATPPPVPTGLAARTEGSQVLLSWEAVGNADLAEYRLYRAVRASPDTSGSSISVVPAGRATFTDTTVEVGEAYRYGLTAVDTAGNESALSGLAGAFLPPRRAVASARRTFGGASGPEDYRLVALPGRPDTTLPASVPGKAGTEWQAYRETGQDLIRYDGTEEGAAPSEFIFRTGRGFWLTSRQAWAFEDTLDAAPVRDSTTRIPLNDGWTIVANPFEEAISWAALQAKNGGGLEALWPFGGAFGDTSRTFRSATSGRAYYLFNGDPDRDSLVVPHPALADPAAAGRASARRSSGSSSPKAESPSKAAGASASLLSLSARPAGAEKKRSVVRLGLASSTAREQRLRAPPGRLEPVSMRIVPSDGADSTEKPLLMRWQRGLEGEGTTIRLRLTSRVEGPVLVEASGLQALRGRKAALLVPGESRSYDLQGDRIGSDGGVRLRPDDGEQVLKLAVGSERYVENRREEVLPSEVHLEAYPNPASRQATIEYALPERRRVSLKVYDALGRRVVTVVNGRKEAGRHTARLRTAGLASGLYFGRLRAAGKTRTVRITVVR